MAKTPRKRVALTEDDAAKYAALPPELQKVVDAITDPARKSAAIKDLYDGLQSTAPSQTATTGATTTQTTVAPTTAAAPQSTVGAYPGSNTAADATGGRFERAIGLETGRFVDPVTRAVIEGTTQRVGSPATSVTREARGEPSPGFIPRYFDRDADLIARFTRDQIADIQSQLRKSGLLGDKYRVGVADDVTKTAWVKLLGEANNSNVDWKTALGTAAANPIGGTALPPKVSNPDDIRKVINQVSSKVLGRNPDETFVTNMIQQLQRTQAQPDAGAQMSGGMRVAAPQAETMIETGLRKAAGAEADAFKATQFIDLLMRGI